MYLSRFFVATILVLSLALVGTAGGDKAKKLVGVWEITKSQTAPPGATAEFTADGKMRLRAKADGKEFKVDGTYKLKDDTIEATLTFEGQTKTDKATIKTLTDKQLIIQDKDGKTDEYKRVK